MKPLLSKSRGLWAVLAVAAAVAGLALVSPQAFAGGGGAQGSAAVDAEVLGVSVVRRADRTRAVMVELRTDERITVQVRVLRRAVVIAHSRVFVIGRPDRWLVSYSLPRRVSAGRAHALVRLADREGNVARPVQPIRIPAR
jgi:hypothetical protein